MNDMPITLEWIEHRREELGLNKDELGKKADVNIFWFTRGRGPTMPSLRKLAKVLGPPPQDAWHETACRLLDNMPKTELGKWLVQCRAKHRICQREAAARLDISQSQWSNWERGNHCCQPRYLSLLESHFGKPPKAVYEEVKRTQPWKGECGKPQVASRTKVGARLRDARMALGWSVSLAAEKLGMKENTLFCWELGWRNPSLKNLLVLADGYGVSLDWLLCREDKTNVPT